MAVRLSTFVGIDRLLNKLLVCAPAASDLGVRIYARTLKSIEARSLVQRVHKGRCLIVAFDEGGGSE
jgi:hypothetical protein